MKRILLLLIISVFLMAASARAVELHDGYIVKEFNDTVKCKVKGGRFLSSPFYGITIVDEQGKEQFLRALDKKITAFGFVKNFTVYHFLFVKVGDRLENGFYQLIVNGPRYKLYSRPKIVADGIPAYLLFNPSGEFKTFEPCILCPWKKQLRELLRDDANALEQVENAPRVNIPKFVMDINKV